MTAPQPGRPKPDQEKAAGITESDKKARARRLETLNLIQANKGKKGRTLLSGGIESANASAIPVLNR